MAERVADDYWDDWGAVLLWTAVFSRPLGWVISELVGYWFVKPVCANGHRVILTVIAAIYIVTTGIIPYLMGACE